MAKIQGSRPDPDEEPKDDDAEDENDGDTSTGAGDDGDENDAGSDEGDEGNEGGKGKGERMFTQAEVDDLIARRLRREKRKAKGKPKAEPKADDDDGDDNKGKGEDASARIDERLVKAEARQVARDLKVRPDRIKAVLRQADLSGLDPDDTDDIEDAIAEVLEDFPEWKAEPAKDVRPKVRSSSRDDTKDGKTKRSFTRAEIAAMSDAEYDKNRDAIMAALAAGNVKG